MSFIKHENKIVYEEFLVVKAFTLRKTHWKMYENYRKIFDCLFGYSVLFLCYMKLISFSL